MCRSCNPSPWAVPGKRAAIVHPKIREGVMIGAGAKILGQYRGGARRENWRRFRRFYSLSRPHTTAAGVPARIVGKPGSDKPSMDMDQHFNGIHHTF
ncbi:serine acetyltransferase [Salmonella enterica subsp. enterica]|uniref:Serine acetyltransferase n=1 Tax=Salmonella enterica I TaxID=59201 RepID=A0A3S4IND4_SALET|nr:serine acetyltransferase [Salmonella enterica subsp. enterica]